ncbi:vWA domain-containing protein [Nocardia goodfellowii]|uniref:Stress response protein SCP2 n=1 Tax=Nocardia goodfellowii TaxID=882446 RepID=A0ABS4QRQ5_9NOCA|nr:VWA domain-containing protein [Nocardia goodfellowii]MBP2194357.1 stress response protein SCP2 [Nocardia goodfellowii]
MSNVLRKGQNAPLATSRVVVSVRTDAATDLSALLVIASGKARSDADFVFFNQPAAPGVELRAGPSAALDVSLDEVPADIAQVRAVLTSADAGATFGQFGAPAVTVEDAAGNVLYDYRIEGLGAESVVIALEFYRRDPGWKVRAVGQGYAGGFADFVTDHGISVDDEGPETVEIRTVPGEAELSPERRGRLDLRKRAVVEVLHSRNVRDVRARVVLVIDKTGSIAKQYHTEVVHRVVDRMIPIAIQLDDDGTLEAYLYALHFAKLPDVTVAGSEQWSRTYLHLTGTHGGIEYDPLGLRNDELPIMRTVIDTLRPGDEPTLVLFFTDGGFKQKREITELMREAARLPAFWQFVGLGKANYGVLGNLDEMAGRVVDNVGFFTADDIDRMDDAELYERLLGEFADWLHAARAAGIVAR